jgi:hypothetical protein
MGVVHAVLNILALVFLSLGIYFANRHRLRVHHILVFSATSLLSASVVIMLIYSGGLINLHCVLGIIVWFTMFVSVTLGFLFRKRLVKRKLHKALGLVSVLSMALQVIFAFLLS